MTSPVSSADARRLVRLARRCGGLAHPLQYLLGDRLLVAPVVEPARTTWSVYLPAGTWVDAWTDEVLAGGRIVERPVPIDRIPVFRRGEEPDARLDSLRKAGDETEVRP